MNTVVLDMDYYFKGSSNTTLGLRQNEIEGIDLITDYGEIICTIYNANELYKILEKLNEDKYA